MVFAFCGGLAAIPTKVQRNAEQVYAVLASEMRLGSLGVLVIGRLCAYFTETSTHLSLDRHVLINKFIVVNAVQWLFLDMIFLIPNCLL